MLASEIIAQAEQNVKIRNRKYNHQNKWFTGSVDSMNGIISSAHKDMNAEAHISEILDSDAEDEIEKERS